MRFRIPPQYKRIATVKRESAYDRSLDVIAEDIVCSVQPGRDRVHLDNFGVPIRQSDLRANWTVLLEVPNKAITEGDILFIPDLNPDGTQRLDANGNPVIDELKIYNVRYIKGGTVMRLEINNAEIP